MRYFILLISLFFCLIASGQNTYTVSNGGDSGSGSLRQAVLDANAHAGADFIVFSGNFQVTLTSGEISINDPVTITGNGIDVTIVDGNANSRIFASTTTASSIIVRNMTLQNGYATPYVFLPLTAGGGAISSAVDLNLKKIKFLNNTVAISADSARADGGAVSISGSSSITLTIDSCLFNGNKVLRGNLTGPRGGAFGGAVSATGSTIVNVSNTTFTNNISAGGATNIPATTTSSGGGAIYTSGPTCSINNCTFSNNKSSYNPFNDTYYDNSGNGGAILVLSSTLNLLGACTFENNIAGGNGGGIYKNAGTFNVTGLTSLSITGNQAGVSGAATPGTNTASGGGINTSAPLTLSASNNAVIRDNSTFGNGGGIHTTASLTLDNISLITNNSATFGGGAINASGALTLKNMTISGNKAGYNAATKVYSTPSGSGGGAIQAGSNFTLIGDIVFQRDTVAGYGGAFFRTSNSPFNATQLTSLLISENATVNGGSAHGGGFLTRGDMNITNGSSVVIRNNSSNAQGGGFYIQNGAANYTVYLKNATISDNAASGSGGGVYLQAPSATPATTTNNLILENSTVENNTAGYNPATGTWIGSSGAGINSQSNLTLIGSIMIRNNRAGLSGGGIFKAGATTSLTTTGLTSFTVTQNKAYGNNSSINAKGGGIYTESPLTLTNANGAIITDNLALGDGGGVYTTSTGTLVLNNPVSITNNAATVNGGAVYASGPLTLNNTTVSGNKAGYNSETKVFSNQSGGGGAIYALNVLTLIGNLVFQNDTISGNGGAIYKAATGAFNVTGTTSLNLSGNTAQVNSGTVASGGAIYTLVPLSLNAGNGVSINNNSADINGGAIYANDSLTLTSLSILNNKALASGGAIFMGNTGKLFSTANTFFGNNAKDGGAIYGTTSSILNILNSTFFLNTSSGNGGAIGSVSTAAGTNTNITLSTFNANTATAGGGQAIYLANTTGKLLNGNLIYGNGSTAEIIPASGIAGAYNILRGVTLPFTDLTTNKAIAAGRGKEIYTNIISGDQAGLQNNGGPTQTLKIIRNGFAYNFIPSGVSWLSGISSDQTGLARVSGCDMDAGAFELQTIDPATSTWIAAGNADDWNDPNNWENRDGSGTLIAGQALPSRCTNVIIPPNKTFYPVLAQAGTPLSGGNVFIQAACDTITFKFGGEVAKTSYLNYNYAKVDLTLRPSRWYTLAPVLRQQYSGDYQESGSQYRINPEISMMYYQTGNPQTGAARVSAKFTGLFNNLDQLLPTCTGYAVWLDEGNRTSETDFTIHFPKDSTKYAYYLVETNQVTRFTGTLIRKDGGNNFINGRFIYEGNGDYNASNGNFSQTIANTETYPQAIIGNPYMSHLDIVKFQRANTSTLGTAFRVWKGGTSYESYLINGDGSITGTDPYYKVAPMQSFIFNTNGPFSNPAPVSFSPDMSVTDPGQTLRSVSENTSDVLRVELLRQGVRQSGIALRYKEGASRHYQKDKDVWTIIPESFGSYACLYSLVDGNSTSIYTTGDITTPIDLGISVGNTIKKGINSGTRERYTIQIAGTENRLVGEDVYLYDALNKTTYNLSQGGYDFTNATGDVTGRFQLFTKKIPTGIEDVNGNNPVRIFSDGNQIYVESNSGDPIQEISVYTTVGSQIYHKGNLNTAKASFVLGQKNQFLLVNIKTGKTSHTEKIILR